MKRLTDIALALLLLPLALLLCVPAAIAIRLETPGNPLFLQKRVGRNQRPFTLWKLRSMSKGTKQAGSHEVGTAHVTRMGHIIRRTKIDELPQICNVLLGQMSFVGPRPCLPTQEELIAERAQRGVFDVLPGITGPAQLAGIDMSTPRPLAEADAAYIATRSWTGDLRLIVQTATGGGRGDAAVGLK
ncbi:sugar transferase [Yoonia sp. SS1-5]|uniref:Sugar transferase n=1 Tax=Yoonia rhodophyticola TaxID=3137370 RepID=A0AAN0NL53_9RHOB